ncbi:MAG: hypothetical protein NWS40_07285 [Crocinitomicaceae bacterium]|jgi:hypothetical protein|nr:hypothetical protein [Crocinitomicaceae bacterium]MDP5009968.1 hypothetical protein [Crocinitomicaceae bacterium]
MKKSISLVALALVASSILSSCKKNQCTDCHYEKNGLEVELGEKCGDDIEALEASGYNDGGTVYEVHCHEH